MKNILSLLTVMIIVGVACSTTYAFAVLADNAGHVKPHLSAQDGRIVLGHRVGPDGNIQLVYKN